MFSFPHESRQDAALHCLRIRPGPHTSPAYHCRWCRRALPGFGDLHFRLRLRPPSVDVLHQRAEDLGNTPGLSHASRGPLRRVAVENF